MEKKLQDLMYRDYHLYLALHYTAREQAGFMPLERFVMARDRAIGDIRACVQAPSQERQPCACRAQSSWQGAFQRACRRDPGVPQPER